MPEKRGRQFVLLNIKTNKSMEEFVIWRNKHGTTY